MTPDVAQGVSAELKFLLKPEWALIQEADRFRIKPPPGSNTKPDFHQLLGDELWRIAQFVAYSHFVSISKNEDGGYTLVSRMESGNGYTIVFEIA
jgi:hypothetical protein